MKKKILVCLATLLCCFCLAACSHTVTFLLDGEAHAVQTAAHNTPVEEPQAPVKDGFLFDGWYRDSEFDSPYRFSDLVSNDLTLYAKMREGFTVTLVYGNGEPNSTHVIYHGDRFERPEKPTLAHHTFEGWYTDESLETAYVFSQKVTGDLTLYAKYEPIQYRVKLVFNNGNEEQKFHVNSGLPMAKPESPTKEHYTFVCWCTDITLTKPYDFSTEITESLTLYAKYEPIQYRVTLNTNNGEPNQILTVNSGHALTHPKDPIKTHYRFLGWYTDSDLTTPYDFNKTVTSPFTLYAKYERITYEVTFVSHNGEADKTLTVNSGDRLEMPADPKKTKYVFSGWYTDDQLEEKYQFSTTVTKSFTLQAKYELDTKLLSEQINNSVLAGIVKIYNKSYNFVSGKETNSITLQGTGFCFAVENGTYYILTNCHVALKGDHYKHQSLIVEDTAGNTYSAQLYENAISPEYDLACLYFTAANTDLQPLSLHNSNLAKNEDLIAVGFPIEQDTTIGFGKALGYATTTMTNTPSHMSNVTFPVLSHDATTNGGSSGSPIFDVSLRVVGIHYAGSTNTTPHIGLAIPVEKILEFLNTYFDA